MKKIIITFGIFILAVFCLSAFEESEFEESESTTLGSFLNPDSNPDSNGNKFTITVEGAVDAFYKRTYLGDYTTGDDLTDPNLLSPYKYQGAGITNMFQSSAFYPGIRGRLGIELEGEKLGGSMELRMRTDSEFSEMTDWDTWFKLGQSDSFRFRVLAGNTVQNGLIQTYDNFNEFLKANIRNLGVMVPVWRINSDKVKNIESISNFPHGYMAYNQGSDLFYSQFYGSATYDLFMPPGAAERKDFNLLADFIFTPVTVTLGIGGLYGKETIPTFDIFTEEDDDGARYVKHDPIYAPGAIGGMNFAVRIESAPLAELLTVAAVYKHNSSFRQKTFDIDDFSMVNYALADVNRTNHGYGLYFNLSPVDTIGITLGYSGQFQTWTNPQYESFFRGQGQADIISDPRDEHWFSRFSEAKFPMYHGVDLRLMFKGINKLSITFNNNFSFARALGISPDDADNGIYTVGWAYSDFLGNKAERFYASPIVDPNNGDGKDRSELYMGLFNAIGISYAFNDNVLAEIALTSQLGRFSLDWEGKDTVSSTHYMGAYIGAVCSIFDTEAGIKGTFRGGADVRLSSFSYQRASLTETMPKFSAGVLEIGIPISIMIQY